MRIVNLAYACLAVGISLSACSSKPSDSEIKAGWLAEYGEYNAVPADLTCATNGPLVKIGKGITKQPMTCTGTVSGAISVRHLTVIQNNGKTFVRDLQ